MAWNGSDGNNQQPDKKRVTSPRLAHGLCAGIVIVVIASFMVYILTRDEATKPTTHNDTQSAKAIAEVAPSHVDKTNGIAKQSAPTKPEKVPFWKQDNTNGFSAAMIRKWKFEHRNKPAVTNDVATMHPKMPFEIFPSHAENTIAALMSIEPGQSIVGLPRYGKSFEDEFMKSCDVPIVIEPEDDDYTRELKKAMIDVKIEIRERMAKGESLSDILIETRKEAMRLNQLKQDLIEETRALIRETQASDEEADGYLQAANRVLEKNGIAPVKSNVIIKRSLMQRIKNQENR